MTRTLYLRCAAEDIAGRVLLTGDPARVERIGQVLDSPRWIARNREFHILTGHYRGELITALSSGIGAPSAAIAIEELKLLGAHTVVRVGTTMGISAPLGTLVLSTGAARFEGTSAAYLPLPYPAVPNWPLSQAIVQVCRAKQQEIHLGLTATYDAFYPHMAPVLASRPPAEHNMLKQAGVLALDMETSLLYILGQTLEMAVTSICAVTVQAEPFRMLDSDRREQVENQLIHIVLEALTDWTRG